MSCLLIHILKIIQPIRLFRPIPQLRSLEYVHIYQNEYTGWKFQDFPITQILREINFRDSES